MKKLIELSVDGAKVLDLCIEGDKLLEQGTGAVYNKAVKGVKVSKGMLNFAVDYALWTMHSVLYNLLSSLFCCSFLSC